MMHLATTHSSRLCGADSKMRVLPLVLILILASGCGNSVLEPSSHTSLTKGSIYAGAIDDKGAAVVVGSIHHGISYWRLTDSERLYDWKHIEGVDTELAAADFSPDGEWIVTADKNTLALWSTATGEGLRYWQAPGEILSVQLTNNGDRALVGLSDQTAVLFDVRQGGILSTLRHSGPVRSIALDPSGDTAATASEDRTAVSWDMRTNKRLAAVRHSEEVQLSAISADGELVLSVSKYDKAIIWRSSDGAVVAEIPLKAGRLKRGLRFTSARFSADKRFLLTGQTDQTVSLWRLDDLKNPTSWKVETRRLWKPMGAAIIDVAFTPNEDEFLALASNGILFRLKLPSAK
jgi:WD40 repeat protein